MNGMCTGGHIDCLKEALHWSDSSLYELHFRTLLFIQKYTQEYSHLIS